MRNPDGREFKKRGLENTPPLRVNRDREGSDCRLKNEGLSQNPSVSKG